MRNLFDQGDTVVSYITLGEYLARLEKPKCEHLDIKLSGKFETEVLECRCGFKIPF